MMGVFYANMLGSPYKRGLWQKLAKKAIPTCQGLAALIGLNRKINTGEGRNDVVFAESWRIPNARCHGGC